MDHEASRGDTTAVARAPEIRRPQNARRRRGWAVTKALAVLVLVGGGAWLFSLLDHFEKVEPPPRILGATDGHTAWWLRSYNPPHLVVSARLIRIDPAEGIYQTSDTRNQLLPAGPVIYIDKDGVARNVAIEQRLPRAQLDKLFDGNAVVPRLADYFQAVGLPPWLQELARQ